MINKNNIEKIIFFNNFNNGDIHYSRDYIKFFAKKIGVPSFISHNKCPSLLKDTNIPFLRANLSHLTHIGFHFQNGVLYFNTWIGQENFKWLHSNFSGCTLSNNHRMFSEKARILEIEIPTEENFIPSIDYSFFDVEDIKINHNKNLFISNGPCLSGQCVNFDMDGVVVKIAEKYPNYNFFTTQKINTNLSNIIDANSLIKNQKNTSNLNELSYISTSCKIIIGRASGPFCFTHTKENLFDKNKTFIVACNNEREGHWAFLEDYSLDQKSRQLWCDGQDQERLTQIINTEIKSLIN